MNDLNEFKKIKESERKIHARVEESKLRSSQIKKESVSKLEQYSAAKNQQVEENLEKTKAENDARQMAIFKTLTEKQKRLEQFFKSQKYDDKDRQKII